jgi:hypothetical protein
VIRDENSYIAAALRSYDNPQCISLDEFREDLYRVHTIGRCINRYNQGDELNFRLILNHFIVLFNVFGATALELIKYKLDHRHFPVAYAFIVKINRLPEDDMLLMDQFVVQKLREI